MIQQPRYVVITPAKDEGEYLEGTIQSVAGQTIKPVEWVIVNDGSTDNTGEILDRYAAKYPWIVPVHREGGVRQAGGGVIRAFYAGYDKLASTDWHFIVKLDGDLSFEPDYFERCFARFAENPKLGVGGGLIYHVINGQLVPERSPRFHVRGATKIYTRDCWMALGGFIEAPGWDTLDEVKANMLGWTSETFEDIPLTHHRYTGAADGTWKNAVKNGRANYISGYHPLFMLAKCVKRLFQKPYLLGAAGLFFGYVSGSLKRTPRVNDPGLINYLRSEQLKKLTFGKSIWG